MKTYFKILLVTAIFASSCSPSYMGSTVYEDDLYYNPNQAPLLVQKVEANSPAVQKSNALAPANATQSSTKTKPNTGSEALDDRNFEALQQKYTEILNDESIGSVDTLIYEGDSGYYLGGFSGSERDQEEAQRLREMYPQGFGYYDNSGYNTAMWLAGDSDWNVYVDGNNVWWTPTWTNYRMYNGYNFSTMRYGNTFAYNYPYRNYGYNSYWGFNMGFGDSWYWDLNFGWGFSNYYYGSYYPYYGHSGYYGHGYYGHGHHGYYGNNYATSIYNGKRRSNNYKAGIATNADASRRTSTTATSASTRRSTASSTKAGTLSTTRRSVASDANDIRRSNAAARYSSGNGNSYGTRRTVLNSTSDRRSTYGTTSNSRTGTSSRNNYSNGTANQTKSSSYSNTRRSSSPSYNKPQTNTRPSYNRSSNSSNSNYSKSSTRSSYSKVKSTSSKPTYRSGSSNSKSNYNSGTRRSSGSSGTSRSSVGTSRSSSSSSGSSTRSSSGSSRSSSGSSNSSNSGGSRRR